MSPGPQSNDQRKPDVIELHITRISKALDQSHGVGENVVGASVPGKTTATPKEDKRDAYYIQLRHESGSTLISKPEMAVPLEFPAELFGRRAGYLTHAEYGKKLGDAVFEDPEIIGTMHWALGASRNGTLRLRIHCDDDNIQSLHWETIQFNGGPVFRDRVSLSRYLSPPRQESDRTPQPRSALRALIFIASPPGLQNQDDSDSPEAAPGKLTPIAIATELGLAEKALKFGGNDEGIRIETEFLGSPGEGTFKALRTKLAEGEGFDLLYLVCHGAFDETGAYLYLESDPDDEGTIKVCKAEDLVTGLTNKPSLVVLASCESSGTGNVVANSKIPFWSKAALGPKLARAGIPAVVAMQGKVSIQTAEHFARGFFSQLCIHGDVDRSLAVARGIMHGLCPDDYWMPALFSSSTRSNLFEPCARVNNVPPLPSDFVARPLLQAEIAAALSGGRSTVLLGAGGFGKTTLTIAACRSEEVTAAFPGGVLWTSLGTNPDTVQLLTDLYVTAKRARPEVAGREQLVEVLAKALNERAWLLALDDVWRAEDLEPFLQLGARSLLVSTRKQNLLQEAGQDGWQKIEVGEITGDEAAAFLARGLRLEGPPPAAYCSLAEQLGGWPLLLDLVNARLREEKKSRPDFLQYVTRLFEKKGVLGFDRRDTNKRTLAVALSVEVGLDRAEQMYPGLARKAAEISIFPENIPIPFQVLQDLWALDEFDLEEDVLRPLTNLSLVRRDREGIRVHMMIDRALKEKLNKADGGPAAVHRRLIEAWGEPARLPHDYAWRWFGWHCVQAGESARLKGLLLDVKWLQAKLDATDSNALIGDFELLTGDDRGLNSLKNVVQLSAHVLATDKSQLAGQLLGRIPESENTLREAILKGAVSQNRAWLRPLRPSLTAPGGPLLRTLEGHSSAVRRVALTPDGKCAVSESDDGTLKIWDLETGRELYTLKREYGRREYGGDHDCLAVTADGKRVVSGSWMKEPEEHSDELSNPLDWPRWEDGVFRYYLRLWDLETGAQLRTLQGSESWTQMVNIWALEANLRLRRPYLDTDLAVSADGRRTLSASNTTTLEVWNRQTGVRRPLYAKSAEGWGSHADAVNGVAMTADGKWAVSASRDRTLKVWDLETAKELRTLTGHSGAVCGVAMTADGKRVVSASADGTLKVWDPQRGAEASTLAGHSESVVGVAAAVAGKMAVSVSLDRVLKVWDLQGGIEWSTMAGHYQEVTGVAVSADGKRAITASCDQTLKVQDLRTGEDRTLKGHAGTVTGVAMTPDGKRAVSASYDRTVKVWDLETGALSVTLKGLSTHVKGVAVSPDGTRVVAGSLYGTLKVWDVETGEELHTLTGHADEANGLAVTPDGKRVVSASLDKTIKVWDMESGKELRTLTGHRDGILALAVTADGKRAVSASRDTTVKVWDLQTGGVLATFTCDAPSSGCSFTGEGEVIAGDSLGGMHFLRLEEPDL